MNTQRGKLGLAFGGVALAGIVLGFAVSARLSFTGKVAAAPTVAQSALTPMQAPSTTKTAPPPVTLAQPATPIAPLAGAPGSFAPLVKQVGPSVVQIDVRRRGGPGLGTGFVISTDGYVATNEHVVDGAVQIVVNMVDGRRFSAELVGSDPKTDIALLKIESNEPLPALVLGDSDALEVGEWVMAIGSPLGLDHTVTAGIVSAKQRRGIAPSGRRSNYEDFIQTDASINPGNSGGPLLNMKGEVVGINSAVSLQGQGISFAIPINMAKKLLPMLRDKGYVERSYMGIHIGEVDPDVARQRQVPDGRGAFVDLVEPGSPAEAAGIERGDIVLEFDGQLINRANDLPLLASTAGVGKTVDVVVMGARGSRTVKITLGRMQ